MDGRYGTIWVSSALPCFRCPLLGRCLKQHSIKVDMGIWDQLS